MADEIKLPDSLEATPSTLGGAVPTDDDICSEALALAKDIGSDFEERNRLFEAIENVIFLQNAPYVPEAFKKTAVEVRSPLPSHMANNITAALSVNAPNVRFTPVGFGDAAEENRALRETFFKGSWERQEQEAGRRLFRPFAHAVVTKGVGILKTVERTKRAWAGFDEASRRARKELAGYPALDDADRERLHDARMEEFKRAAPYPIVTIDVPPETFCYVQGEDGFQVAIEDKQVPYYQTLRDYRASLDEKGRVVSEDAGLPTTQWGQCMGKRRTLRMVEVWTWDTAVWVLQGPGDLGKGKSSGTGFLVKRIEHGYGDRERRVLRGPYFLSHGITTSSREHGRQGLSVLFGYLDLFGLLDSLLTIQSQAASAFGFPAYKRVTPPTFGANESPFGTDALETAAKQEEVVPGKIFPYDVAPLQQPTGGIDLDKAISQVRQLLDYLLPAAVQGAVSGDMAGYALNQAQHLARLAWDPIVDNMEFALSQRTGFESWLIENRVGERVYVYGDIPRARLGRRVRKYEKGWLGLGPEDLNGLHRYSVELEPEKPENKILDSRLHRDLLELGLETKVMAIEAMGNQPSEVERGLLLEAIKAAPEVQAALKQRVLQRLSTLDQQVLQQAGAGAPGAPPQPQQPAPPQQVQPPMQPPSSYQEFAQGQQGLRAAGQPPGPPAVQGGTPGTPTTPNPPQNMLPLPGQ